MIAVKNLVDVGVREHWNAGKGKGNQGIKSFKFFFSICSKILAKEGSKNHKSDIVFFDSFSFHYLFIFFFAWSEIYLKRLNIPPNLISLPVGV